VNYDIIGIRNSFLGEGPVWCKEKNCLYYLDVSGKKLHAIDWETKEVITKELPQMAGCIALTKNSKLIYAMEDGIYNEDFELLHEKEEILGIRFNDGKVAPNGSFFTGTIKKEGGGRLYRLTDKLETILDDVKISNGIDWSVDEKTMYYCDTATHMVVAYDFDNGNIKNKRDIIRVPNEMGNPDGLCIDMEGYLWVALWGGYAVIRVNPSNGEIADKIEFPVSKVSCPCFVGGNLDKLVVTTASVDTDLVKEPLAGCTFLVDINIKGRNPYRFGVE